MTGAHDLADEHLRLRRSLGIFTEPLWPTMADSRRRPRRLHAKLARRHGAKSYEGGRWLQSQIDSGGVVTMVIRGGVVTIVIGGDS